MGDKKKDGVLLSGRSDSVYRLGARGAGGLFQHRQENVRELTIYRGSHERGERRSHSSQSSNRVSSKGAGGPSEENHAGDLQTPEKTLLKSQNPRRTLRHKDVINQKGDRQQ